MAHILDSLYNIPHSYYRFRNFLAFSITLTPWRARRQDCPRPMTRPGPVWPNQERKYAPPFIILQSVVTNFTWHGNLLLDPDWYAMKLTKNNYFSNHLAYRQKNYFALFLYNKKLFKKGKENFVKFTFW
jgi:hypothetical protein